MKCDLVSSRLDPWNFHCAGIRLKVWKNEIVGTTVMHSSVLNLHQPGKKLPARGMSVCNVHGYVMGL